MLDNNHLITFEAIQQKIGKKTNLLFEYNALCTALRSRTAVQALNNANTSVTQPHETNLIMPAKVLRLKMSENNYVQPCCINFWNEKYDLSFSKHHWLVASKCTKEERLKLLHWKILHNIYPTNILLHKMGLRPSTYCSFCQETDYTEHLFLPMR